MITDQRYCIFRCGTHNESKHTLSTVYSVLNEHLVADYKHAMFDQGKRTQFHYVPDDLTSCGKCRLCTCGKKF